MINEKGYEVIKDFFEPLLFRYQVYSEGSMKDNNFTFDYVDF